eukprot:jgi/Botrbrau1/8031/Bobra.13_2s0008.1
MANRNQIMAAIQADNAALNERMDALRGQLDDILHREQERQQEREGEAERHFKRTRMGAPGGQAAALQPPQGQGQGLGQWEWQQPLLFHPPTLQEQAGVAGMAGLAAGQAWGGAQPYVPYPKRRDGAAPYLRVDTRVAIPPDRRCHACHCRGHEFHMCPFRKLQNNIPLTQFDQLTIELCLQQCAVENRVPPHIYMTQGRGRGAIHGLPAPKALPAGGQGWCRDMDKAGAEDGAGAEAVAEAEEEEEEGEGGDIKWQTQIPQILLLSTNFIPNNRKHLKLCFIADLHKRKEM